MKVLIVSFDRNLVKQLKSFLSGYEVMDVKNGEEALNLAIPYFDVIIYDAISGALSEEDINNMYQQKFKDAKFVVLVDDLFPINAQNLKPQKKILIPRESTPDQVLSAITAPVQETKEYQLPTLELEIETHKQTVEELEKVIESAPSEQESIEALFFEKGLKPTEVQPESKEEVTQYISESVHPKKKVAVVSFDSTLVDSITSLLSEEFEPVALRSFRNLESLLKDVDGVIFDAISGLAAKKRLMELAKDQDIAQKPFLVLIDELFNINIDDVPLRNKHAISRGESPREIVDKFKEIFVPLKEEEETLMQMLGELLEKQEAVQEKEKGTETEVFTQITKELEMPELEESPLPTKEFALEEQKEEALPTLSAAKERTERLEDTLRSLPLEDIKQVIEITIKEEIKRVFQGFNPSDLARELLREELKKSIESIPLESIIREMTYEVLRERLRELIT
uniref:Response regulator transcription factor n=1 Tax=Thermocrinis ruber TaxID=75906 RepID=A0A7C5X3T8_9AQUI